MQTTETIEKASLHLPYYRKAIRIINHTANWHTYPIITTLQTHPHVRIPPPHSTPLQPY
jgi:hypothetical protein